MAVHQLSNTHSWQKKQQEEHSRNALLQYPGAVRAQIDKLIHQLNRKQEWLGDTEVEILIMGRYKWSTTLSHLGIRSLRRRGFTIKCVGGFDMSINNINKIFEKYGDKNCLREQL